MISDEAFLWWKEHVERYQDRTIITVSHACLRESDLLFSEVERSIILESQRFAGVLKKYRVSLWLSGHTVAPTVMRYNENKADELNGTLFINISGIRKEPGMPCSSRILIFKKGSRTALIKMRDHDRRAYLKCHEQRIELPVPFSHDGSPPRVVFPKGTVVPLP